MSDFSNPSLNQPGEALRLDGIVDDVHYLIASELLKSSPDAVRALGQSSKTMRQATLPFIYRHLVLKKASYFETTYEAFIERFRMAQDCEISKHVRCLTVKDDVPEEDLLLVLDRVAEFGALRKLNWETSEHMPASVLDKLHATWPNLELSVCCLNRIDARKPAHRQMDMKLLSSPLIRSLTYNVFFDSYRADEPAVSEWPRLTKALAVGGSVRKLRLQGSPDSRYNTGGKILAEDESKAMLQLAINPGMQFSALEELTLRGQSYSYLWDITHCELLRDTLDWSRLRKLDFGNEMPEVFFATMKGRLPKLQALRFGVPYNTQSVGTIKRFIESLDNLTALDIIQAGFVIAELWPSIMKHKKNLKELLLRPTIGSYCSHECMDLAYLKRVATDFPSLERLGWDAPCFSSIDPKHLNVLSTMKLRRLDLFLHLPHGKSLYSDRLVQNAMGTISPPPINKEGSKLAAVKIMETISKAQRLPLETLTLYLSRTGSEDRAQPYIMQGTMQLKRSEMNGGFEVRGKQEWSWGMQLEEDMFFEN